MEKKFDGHDIVFETVSIISDAISEEKELKEVKEWNKRTLFIAKKCLYYYLDNGSWVTVESHNIQEIREFETNNMDYVENLRDKYVIQLKYSESMFRSAMYCLFEEQKDSQCFYTVLKAYTHPDPMIQYFVNPGVGIVTLCLLYKAITGQSHVEWETIRDNEQEYETLFRHSDSQGVTPLHVASYFSMTTETAFCLQSSRYINSPMGFENLTPLHLAIRNVEFNSEAGSFEHLIKNNAKTDIPDANGNTVMQMVHSELYGSKFHAILDNDSYINVNELNVDV